MIQFKWLWALALLGSAPLALADSAANALHDAKSLASCMKALDTECTLKWLYTRQLEAQGFELGELRAQLTVSFESIKLVHGETERFDVGAPWPPFSGDGKQYIFIPYQETMSIKGQRYSQTAYFIGVSEDAGASWKFVDGIGFSMKNIRTVIPSFNGGSLPPRETDPPSALP
ncbi:MAG TPA: hypothetical protein VGV09_06440 [Steroidobacteraceae bacterium]|nr:hypothetical protein [Steroidobacteraceae bacterium]